MKKVFKLNHSKTCKTCGTDYMANNVRSTYCSKSCYKKVFYAQNKTSELEKAKKWHQEHKEAIREHARKYYEKNKGYYKAKAVAREKDVKRATPKWVDKSALVAIYNKVPMGYHVDHVIPINGENVSGLHVPWNLQYLSAVENIRKSNKV